MGRSAKECREQVKTDVVLAYIKWPKVCEPKIWSLDNKALFIWGLLLYGHGHSFDGTGKSLF